MSPYEALNVLAREIAGLKQDADELCEQIDPASVRYTSAYTPPREEPRESIH
jgi:hypothetical protein